ncbi:MAG: ATP-dependent DNA helicase RecG [Luteibaculum sp.]
MPDAKTDISNLKGLGPERALLLKTELGIKSYADMVRHFPFRYVDRSRITPVAELSEESTVQICGKLGVYTEIGHGRKARIEVLITDATGTCKLVWFKGIKWIKPKLIPGQEVLAFGKPALYGRKFSMAHPELIPKANMKLDLQPFEPIYSSTEKLGKKGLGTKGIQKLIRQNLFDLAKVLPESLPPEIRSKYKLPGKEWALQKIHFPENIKEANWAKRRLKFEELFFLQLFFMLRKVLQIQQNKGRVFTEVGELFNQFYNQELPFKLTGAQKKVLREIRHSTLHGKHMNRLVQGDVGSGKTIVSVLSMLLALDNGCQVCMMAPTEILAQQHFQGISKLLQNLPLQVALLTGSVKGNERKEILEKTEDGSLDILVGTHALIEDHVVFKSLGLAVIDEQHRFGVVQRAKLWQKSIPPPHVLVMTATPIPRTLAMTIYSDLEISVIDELPPGRKPIQTMHKRDSHRQWLFGFMEAQIKEGRQVYVVYPLIEESESMDYKDLEDGFESISRRFPKPQYQVSIVHGRMKAVDKEYEMQRFKNGETQILIATTVIEVGVDVPNASVMVIESAERFGLAQLHQLRGRVGRGASQSYCILMSSNKLSVEARKRLSTMVETQDGFKIAEVDMELRGTGEIMGTRQSGDSDLKLADLVYDANMLSVARQEAKEILEKDPNLELEEHKILKEQLKLRYANKLVWSKIS